jgi:outer membrane immunogenic protein
MRVLVAIGGLLAATNFALAADLPIASAPRPVAPTAYVPARAPTYNWSGFYLGLNGGYGFATASVTGTFSGGSATASENLSGFIGGGQVGFNYQVGMGVFGVEADIDGSSQSKTTTGGIISATDKISYIGTVRGRIGAAFDRVLLYATGGGGYGEFTSTITAAGFGTFSGSKSHALWTVGAGLEVGITSNISARIEYLYADTGNLNLANVAGVTVTGRVQDNLVRAGVNFRFPL